MLHLVCPLLETGADRLIQSYVSPHSYFFHTEKQLECYGVTVLHIVCPLLETGADRLIQSYVFSHSHFFHTEKQLDRCT